MRGDERAKFSMLTQNEYKIKQLVLCHEIESISVASNNQIIYLFITIVIIMFIHRTTTNVHPLTRFKNFAAIY